MLVPQKQESTAVSSKCCQVIGLKWIRISKLLQYNKKTTLNHFKYFFFIFFFHFSFFLFFFFPIQFQHKMYFQVTCTMKLVAKYVTISTSPSDKDTGLLASCSDSPQLNKYPLVLSDYSSTVHHHLYEIVQHCSKQLNINRLDWLYTTGITILQILC